MSLGQHARFTIPAERESGFKTMRQRMNAAAKKAGLKTIQVSVVDRQETQVSFVAKIADRARTPWQELQGYIDDARRGRPFKRTAEDQPVW